MTAEKGRSESKLAVTFSGFVYEGVFKAVKDAMRDRCGNVRRTARNHFSGHAAEAYILSVVGLESFINETVALNHRFMKSAGVTPIDEIHALELRQKFLLVPLLFDVPTFDKSAQPYQDFQVLVRLRNNLVHYRMQAFQAGKGPKYLQALRDRGLLLSCQSTPSSMWLFDILTFRGAYWAYRTMCAMMRKLLELLYDNSRLKGFLDPAFYGPHDFEKEYQELCERSPPKGPDRQEPSAG